MKIWAVSDGARQSLGLAPELLILLTELHRKSRKKHKATYERIDAILAEYRLQGGLNNIWQDYKLFSLWQILHQRHPLNILELGAGTSTAVFAAYVRDHRGVTLTSVDEEPRWLKTATEISQITLGDKRFDLRSSPKQDHVFLKHKASRYASVPQKEYDFVFIDGPTIKDASLGLNTDILSIIEKRLPETILVDMREGTARFLFKYLYKLYDIRLCDLFIDNIREEYNYFTWMTLRHHVATGELYARDNKD